MHIPTRLGKEWRYMAGGALGLAIKEHFTKFSSSFIKTAVRWCGRGNSQLIKMQRSQFSRNQIRVSACVAHIGLGRHRELIGVVQAGIKECTLTVHFQISNKGIPIR